MTIASLNKIAKKDNLKLVKGVKDYFYWIGLDEETGLKLAGLYSTSVLVARFKHLSFDQWLQELENIKKQINNGSKES